MRPNTDVKRVKVRCELGYTATLERINYEDTYARRRLEAIVLDEGSIPSDSTIFSCSLHGMDESDVFLLMIP